jgi:Endonuclease NucS
MEMAIWRIANDQPQLLLTSGIGDEQRLESVIATDIAILGLGSLMLLDRQVSTDHGTRIDLLALDANGTIFVVELKRGRTPREVVAQVLDYGSWVRRLSAERVAHIFETGEYAQGRTFSAAFAEHFKQPLPEVINEGHRLVIVASELDTSTQRIVEYLLEDYGVPVNAVLFRYFRDGASEYLARTWLSDPALAEERTLKPKRPPSEWNGIDFYVLFGPDEHRSWDDAREWCYVSGGGGSRWSKPLYRLHPGARVFVHLMRRGYVAVGRVVSPPVPIGEFLVTSDGREVPLLEISLRNARVKQNASDPELAEYVVRVDWEWDVPGDRAYWEPGLFWRRGTTAVELRDPTTTRRVCEYAGIPDDPDDVAAEPVSEALGQTD